MDGFRAAMVLLGRDERAEEYIEHYAGAAPAPAAPLAAGRPAGIREALAAAVIEGDKDGVTALVERALAEGLSTMEVSGLAGNSSMTRLGMSVMATPPPAPAAGTSARVACSMVLSI